MNDDDFDDMLRARHQSFVADIDVTVCSASSPGGQRAAQSPSNKVWSALLVRLITGSRLLTKAAVPLCGVFVVIVLLVTGSSLRSNAPDSMRFGETVALPWPKTTSAPPSGPAKANLDMLTSAADTVVSFSISVEPNGIPATVEVTTSHGFRQTFNTGSGKWSWSGSQDVGWSTTVTVIVTVRAGTSVVTDSRNQVTPPPPPPPPMVIVSKGDPCGSSGCQASDLCTSQACAYIVVQTANFSGNVTCAFKSDLGTTGFVNESFGPNERRQTRNFYGHPGKRVSVTCGGVEGFVLW